LVKFINYQFFSFSPKFTEKKKKKKIKIERNMQSLINEIKNYNKNLKFSFLNKIKKNDPINVLTVGENDYNAINSFVSIIISSYRNITMKSLKGIFFKKN
jgi:predicted RNA-binding protein with PUA domain